MGRLGNQMFQVAATKHIARLNDTDAGIDYWRYSDYFEGELPYCGEGNIPVHEKEYGYYPLTGQHMDLVGYFQSYKYIDEKPVFKRRYLDIIRSKMKPGKSIGVHIRRGDYVNHPDYYQLPITWYIQAITSIPNWQDYTIYFVSDDMNYCKVHFECLPNAQFIYGTDIEHLMLLSLCDEHVLSNSTFAWWGAYLSNNRSPIYSGKYFRGKLSHQSTKDLYPPEWEEFWPEDSRIYLRDFTFTIPVKFDHNDRKKNLDLSLCMLQATTNSNYILCEQGGDKFRYTEQWATYMQCDSPHFHRTRMLNDMANKAITPYIVNWDCDVFIPPMQLYLMAQAHRNGAAMVYPYDGRFARMERQPWFRHIEQSMDIGVSGGITWKGKNGRPMAETSVGGAVSWNKDEFYEAGMENEYFISFGPEDVERWERAHALGITPVRLGGCLYHMNHYISADSSKNNPHYRSNHQQLDKQRAMSGQQLRDYIDTWPWRHQYTPKYYHEISEGAIRSANITFAWMESIGVKPKNVIDIGCGVGEWWVKLDDSFSYIGVDFGAPKQRLLFPFTNYIDQNMELDFPRFTDKFGLAICLEVAEHLSTDRADALVEALCSYSNDVLFSAAIPSQGGRGHVNEQWQSYWSAKFAANGYYPLAVYPMKDNPNVELWYRQNMVLYSKYGHKEMKVYDFVLPEYYEQIVQGLKNQIK